MRIVILTHNKDRHYYFCNEIIEKTKNVVGVITGGKHVYKTRVEKFNKLIKRKEVLVYLKKILLNILFHKYGKAFDKEKEKAEEDFFIGSKEHFFSHHKHLLMAELNHKQGSINDTHFVSLIQAYKPDVILVMGTCLIGKKIIESAKHVINLHTGLSPYYRGGYTNVWPIIEEDPNKFGVTVHQMSLGIDSGNIIYTIQPEITGDDNYGTINCKCIQLGTRKVIESISNIKGNSIYSLEQWAKGRVYSNLDWNNYMAYLYYKNRDQIIGRSLDNIERDLIPKIWLVNNGKKNDVSIIQ